MNTEMESSITPSSQSPEHCGFAEIWQEHRRNTINHLLNMASTKGFKAHTWHRVKELENEVHGFYRGIQDEFLNKIKGVKDESI
jgi:queuine/archaeosine tRNA-ribosyltransferase